MPPSPTNTLRARLEGISKILLAHHAASAMLPSASKGSDREVLVRDFLSQIYPPQFRFGSGAVVDSTGKMTGQSDVVIEFPFLPSFPAPGANDRLYLAESVAVVIEVKSDLYSHWAKIRKSAAKVIALRRNWRAHAAHSSKGDFSSHSASASRIPYLVVCFKGPKTTKGLEKKLSKLRDFERPDAVFVVDRSVYSGCPLSESTATASGPAGMLAFVNDLAWLVTNVTWAAPKIGPYIDVIGGDG
jgi:hypothetical protein